MTKDISSISTLLLSTAYTTAYLTSIYLLPSTRIDSSLQPQPTQLLSQSIPATSTSTSTPSPSPLPRDRNHPDIIKARLTGVSISTLISCISLRYVLPSSSSHSVASLLGLHIPVNPGQLVNLLVLPMGLTVTLFAGSFWIMAIEGELPGQKSFSWQRVKDGFAGWQGIRTYIMGPLTEELVFRSCIIAVSYLGGISKRQIVFLTPLYFGLAHVHHAWETYVAGGRTSLSLKRGILQSTFQFAYTTLFGWYASFVFIRTGSVIPAFLVHSFCNSMGLPPLAWALHVYPEYKTSLWGSYIVGIAGFIYGFWRWTEPAYFGGSLFW